MCTHIYFVCVCVCVCLCVCVFVCVCVYIYILTKTGYRLASSTDASILTPGHAPVPSLAGPQHAVHKVHAKRKMRDRAFVESLHQVRNHLTATVS